MPREDTGQDARRGEPEQADGRHGMNAWSAARGRAGHPETLRRWSSIRLGGSAMSDVTSQRLVQLARRQRPTEALSGLHALRATDQLAQVRADPGLTNGAVRSPAWANPLLFRPQPRRPVLTASNPAGSKVRCTTRRQPGEEFRPARSSTSTAARTRTCFGIGEHFASGCTWPARGSGVLEELLAKFTHIELPASGTLRSNSTTTSNAPRPSTFGLKRAGGRRWTGPTVVRHCLTGHGSRGTGHRGTGSRSGVEAVEVIPVHAARSPARIPSSRAGVHIDGPEAASSSEDEIDGVADLTSRRTVSTVQLLGIGRITPVSRKQVTKKSLGESRAVVRRRAGHHRVGVRASRPPMSTSSQSGQRSSGGEQRVPAKLLAGRRSCGTVGLRLEHVESGASVCLQRRRPPPRRERT